MALPISEAVPKRFLAPLDGGTSSSALYIGDPYQAVVTAAYSSGSSTLSVDQTFEFPVPGVAVTGPRGFTVQFTYTGKTSNQLTGIPTSGPGSLGSQSIGEIVRPVITYVSPSSMRVDAVGPDLGRDLLISLKRSDQSEFNFPNSGVQYSLTSISAGDAAVELDVEVNVMAGLQAEFVQDSLFASQFLCGENLLASSDDFTQPIWVVSGSGTVVTSGSVHNPGGGFASVWGSVSGHALASGDSISQTSLYQASNGQPLVWGIQLMASAALHVQLVISRSGSDSESLIVPVTTAWTTVFVQHDGVFTGSGAVKVAIVAQSDCAGQSIYLWSAQLNRGAVLLPRLATTSFYQPGRQDAAVTPQAPLYIFRRDQALPQSLRIFPESRQVNSRLPGFIIGEYHWRDETTINQQAIIPTSWDSDVVAIGTEKFSTGIGDGDDIKPIELIASGDDLQMEVSKGQYFDGPFRFYLPASTVIEFRPAAAGPITFTLSATPKTQTPIFVGTWQLDSKGFYSIATQYTYMAKGLSSGPGTPVFQYAVNRRDNTLTINAAPPQQVLFLGTVSGEAVDFFDLPLYPVDRVNRVYIDRGVTGQSLDSANWIFDRDQGTVRVINPTNIGPSIPGALDGEAVFATIDTAIAIEYDTGGDTRIIDSVDINPAVSGISEGYLYLQHKRQKPDTIQLSVDKPVINIPPTVASVIGLTAYGPVYFDGDYAMLIIKTISRSGDLVSNVRLRAVFDPSIFSGLLNYRNPVGVITSVARASGLATYQCPNAFTSEDTVNIQGLAAVSFNGRFPILSATPTQFSINQGLGDVSSTSDNGFASVDIDVVTGGDGTANAVYIPSPSFGFWVPTTFRSGSITGSTLGGVATTSISHDTLVLPQTLAIGQLFNPQEGWLVTLYSIESNNPLFGIIGGDPSLGQVPFVTSGTPGTTTYRTNGIRDAWVSGTAPGSAPFLPINAFDQNGVSYTSPGFTGQVKTLQYGQALPTPTGLSAYFITFLQRVSLQFEAVDSNAISNTVILQMTVAPVVVENPWLIIEDSTQGRINQFRLGWAQPTLQGPNR